MKRVLIFAFSVLAFALGSCSKDSVITPPEEQKPEDEPYVPYTPSPVKEGRAVIAYVTYYGSTLPDPLICTHINYAFAELYMKDGEYRGFKPQGKMERFRSVLELKKKNPELKILLSFTNGVSNSDNVKGGGFSVLAKSVEARKAFAEDCKQFCIEHNLDGIDMDWEFPGLDWSGQPVDKAVDTQNHVLLMKQLRETLGSGYLLTYAGYVMDKQPSGEGYRYIDIKALDDVVDYVNLMTYDMDADGKPHNALSCPSAYWDIERTYKAYINAGISPSKLVLGIPFYGRVSFSGQTTALKYRTIKQLGTGYKIDNWDSAANVPYVTYGNTRYCYYDNPRSIEIKSKWALDRKMYGLMYWENDQDDDKYTLRRAVWEGVMR